FISNTAEGSSTAWGGGAYVAMGLADLNQVKFEGNSTMGEGGGLYASGPVTLIDSTLLNNSADMANGGGLSAGGDLFILNSRLENNVSRFSSGGGAYAQNSARVIGSTFVSNSASFHGGGLAGIEGVEVERSQFFHNSSLQSGGGLEVEGSLNITGSVFISNSAVIGGGVYHNLGGDGRIVNSLFARNIGAVPNASALQLASAGHVDVIHTTIADPSGTPFNPAAAIRLESGSLNITNTIMADHAIGVYNNGGIIFEDYNLFFNVITTTFGGVIPGGHDLYPALSQFADAPNDDYHLRFTADAINMGINAGVYFDFDDQPRPIGPGFDIGFDETGSTIQESIDFTPPGGVVPIPAGVYTESLNLYKPVSLIGASSATTIIRAVTGNRVLTVTGPITSSTQIANLTLRGGNLMGGGFERAGGGVLITNTAYPLFNKVQIISNSADYGGGLYVQSGGAIISGSLLAYNRATGSGGGAYVAESGAVLEQIGGTIRENTAYDGAGVFVQSGQFQQTGGAFLNNRASHWGGGVLIGSGGKIRMDSTALYANSAQVAGGGVFVDVGAAELLNSSIQGNTAYAGGGLYTRDDTASASLLGGNLVGNKATAYGGGIYAGGTLYITGTEFFGNRAYDGSAMEITGTAQARIVNAIIARNEATGTLPSTNASVRFDSSSSSQVLHTTFGNATQPLTRALVVNSGVVTVVNTIVATYTNGLSQFGGQLAEDYNLFFGTPITFGGSINHGSHSLFGRDPLFKGPASDDYHLKGLSPAVNKGNYVGVRRDIDWDARPLAGAVDIGADEASVANITPGPATGGRFTYTTMQNSTIEVDIPPGAVTQTVPIYCSLIDTTTLQLPRRFKFVGLVFELDADLDPVNVLPGSINFNVPVTLSVSYTDEQLASAGITDELGLKLYRYEPLLNDWKP
ncbi:MAG TPA: hypothetical protein VLG46_10300, partial [Anaerolineae bacterium]|nr:hypothetical protein [Anaerolineae bacterium]